MFSITKWLWQPQKGKFAATSLSFIFESSTSWWLRGTVRMELAEDVEMEEKRRAERGAEREKRPFIHKSHSDIKDSFCWSQLQAGGEDQLPCAVFELKCGTPKRPTFYKFFSGCKPSFQSANRSMNKRPLSQLYPTHLGMEQLNNVFFGQNRRLTRWKSTIRWQLTYRRNHFRRRFLSFDALAIRKKYRPADALCSFWT